MLSRRTLDANPHRTRNGWIPSAIIIFITIVLFFVAFCIVISLLPTYLPDKTITGITTNGQSTFLSVRYLTYADLTGKTVANTVNVGQQLSTQLGLPSSALSVQSTQFQSAATTGKRKRQFFRILSTLRERIIVKINFPSTVCKTTFCENNYSNKVKSKIYAVPTVPISFTFTDGTKLDINIFFQALEDVSSGTSSSATITTSTTASSIIISNSPTATPTTGTDTTTAAATTATDTTTAAGTTGTDTTTAAGTTATDTTTAAGTTATDTTTAAGTTATDTTSAAGTTATDTTSAAVLP
ncbi:unnamed protein product [Rotaria magnacalcarata]|uniref:Uncharacterized protein n=1 Tax=Rotaria magnacalcarata TaxID=392030 RepID=A0A815MAZ4_9BILA|nr:unnamed protein product [Rotaria magnacalcarata]